MSFAGSKGQEKKSGSAASIEIDLSKEGIATAVAHSIIGRRSRQEDTAYISDPEGRVPINVRCGSGTQIYGVFDGHGGNRASGFCAEKIASYVSSFEQETNRLDENVLAKALRQLDADFCSCVDTVRTPHSRYIMDDGTTAIVVVLREKTLYVGNVGDSRAILIRSDWSTLPLSRDQKPSRPDEKQRLEASGAKVTGLVFGCEFPRFLLHYWPFSMMFDVPRVNGILAMSRAIGDRGLKSFIISEPEVERFELTEGRDQFLVLATDGVWDVLDNKRVANIIRGELTKFGSESYTVSQLLERAARAICVRAMKSGSLDNITVVIVDLRPVFLSTKRQLKQPMSAENSGRLGERGPSSCSSSFKTPVVQASPSTASEEEELVVETVVRVEIMAESSHIMAS